MDPVEIKLGILMDCIKKKEQALVEILSITENQGTVLQSDLTGDEIRAFMVQMNREKQIYIQTVLQSDTMFENMLKEIGPKLDANPRLYKQRIAELQSMIRRVMDMDVKIRVQEGQNNQQPGTINTDEAVLQKPFTPAAEAVPQRPTKQKPPVMKQAAILQDSTRVIKAYKNNTK